jgi:prevent-host-death family protein
VTQLDCGDQVTPPGGYNRTMDVGIRQLRDHLSRYVDEVQKGQEIVITDHGKAVARIVPIEDGRRKLDQLIAEGLVTPAKRPRSKPNPLPNDGGVSLSEIVIEQRREARY